MRASEGESGVVVIGVRFHDELRVALVLGELPRSGAGAVEDEVLVADALHHRGIDNRPDERGQERRENRRRRGQLDDDGAVILGAEAQRRLRLPRHPGVEALQRLHERRHRREILRIERARPGRDEVAGQDRVAAGVGRALADGEGVAQPILGADGLLRQVERDPSHLVVAQHAAPDVGVHDPETAVVRGTVGIERDLLSVGVERDRDLGALHDRCVLTHGLWRAGGRGVGNAKASRGDSAGGDRRPAHDVTPRWPRRARAQGPPQARQLVVQGRRPPLTVRSLRHLLELLITGHAEG